MKRAWQNGVCLAAILCLATAVSSARADEPAATKQDAAAQQIKALVAGDAFQLRDATSKLLELGKDAVEPLAKEAAEAKPASMLHCFDVLAQLLASENEAASDAAKVALDKLAESENKTVARRATAAIRSKPFLVQRAAIRRANAAVPAFPVQGPMKLSSNENGRTIELERAADGSFSGKIKEQVNGEEKTTDIKAADARELEQKFPEAHKALQKHEERIRNAQQQRANPFGGGAFNANLQINGGANQSVRIKVVNGDRTIEAQDGDEKVEIRDKNGKEIELKHTRPVDGKAKTDEYKAADLDDLKTKHPEAAKLYQKYAPGNGIAGGAAVRIQIQAGPGGLRAGQVQPAPTEFGPASPGPRTIRAQLDDRKIEITDDDGRKIRVKITKTIDGKEAAESFSADNLKELKAEHPDVAKLYEKYTGPQSE
ncbi:MAG: hypothetical protein AABP62_18985 [Planctomycetota bacterium]